MSYTDKAATNAATAPLLAAFPLMAGGDVMPPIRPVPLMEMRSERSPPNDSVRSPAVNSHDVDSHPPNKAPESPRPTELSPIEESLLASPISREPPEDRLEPTSEMTNAERAGTPVVDEKPESTAESAASDVTMTTTAPAPMSLAGQAVPVISRRNADRDHWEREHRDREREREQQRDVGKLSGKAIRNLPDLIGRPDMMFPPVRMNPPGGFVYGPLGTPAHLSYLAQYHQYPGALGGFMGGNFPQQAPFMAPYPLSEEEFYRLKSRMRDDGFGSSDPLMEFSKFLERKGRRSPRRRSRTRSRSRSPYRHRRRSRSRSRSPRYGRGRRDRRSRSPLRNRRSPDRQQRNRFSPLRELNPAVFPQTGLGYPPPLLGPLTMYPDFYRPPGAVNVDGRPGGPMPNAPPANLMELRPHSDLIPKSPVKDVTMLQHEPPKRRERSPRDEPKGDDDSQRKRRSSRSDRNEKSDRYEKRNEKHDRNDKKDEKNEKNGKSEKDGKNEKDDSKDHKNKKDKKRERSRKRRRDSGHEADAKDAENKKEAEHSPRSKKAKDAHRKRSSSPAKTAKTENAHGEPKKAASLEEKPARDERVVELKAAFDVVVEVSTNAGQPTQGAEDDGRERSDSMQTDSRAERTVEATSKWDRDHTDTESDGERKREEPEKKVLPKEILQSAEKTILEKKQRLPSETKPARRVFLPSEDDGVELNVEDTIDDDCLLETNRKIVASDENHESSLKITVRTEKHSVSNDTKKEGKAADEKKRSRGSRSPSAGRNRSRSRSRRRSHGRHRTRSRSRHRSRRSRSRSNRKDRRSRDRRSSSPRKRRSTSKDRRASSKDKSSRRTTTTSKRDRSRSRSRSRHRSSSKTKTDSRSVREKDESSSKKAKDVKELKKADEKEKKDDNRDDEKRAKSQATDESSSESSADEEKSPSKKKKKKKAKKTKHKDRKKESKGKTKKKKK